MNDVSYWADEVPRLTEEEEEEQQRRYHAISDDEIDLSDMPESTEEQLDWAVEDRRLRLLREAKATQIKDRSTEEAVAVL